MQTYTAVKTFVILIVAITLSALASTTPVNAVPTALPDTFAGVYIIDLATGEIIMESNADRPFVPASVTKALTAAAVLSLADSAERFVTPVATIGRIDDEGVLDGNVIIAASGDPTIASSHFSSTKGFADSIASGLHQLGITRIKGRIVVDRAGFVEEPRPEGWLSEDHKAVYGANMFGANYADNKTTITKTVKATKGKGKRRRTITNTVNSTIANDAPDTTMIRAVSAATRRLGIEIDSLELMPHRPFETVYTHLSPRYVDILRSLMVRSDNLFAEGMLRTIAPGSSRRDALAEELDVWEDAGIATDNIFVEDGSGLSRHNRLTPRFLGNVLAMMSQSLNAESYARLFPKVGVEGTVRHFMAGSPIAHRLRLKTGSMRGVQSYAGYFFTEEGVPSHVVVVMANDFDVSRAELRSQITAMLEGIFMPSEAPSTISDDSSTEDILERTDI